MRKKAHRRINANNSEYDRYYIINYLELGKTWEEVQSEDDREMVDDGDDDWSDWQSHPVSAVCLFCDHQSETMEQIYTHMKVKLVNFLRRQLHQSRCYGCQETFSCRQEVLRHLKEAGHVMQLPHKYYFPTYENDALLCTLSDSDEDERNVSEDVPVISEDVSNLRALKQNSVLKSLLKSRGSCR
ncbi:hypothetical protein KUCAC02_037753 [Chaenocephalus aceratus]|nr:hypothetical protein KUCAC02_037753 [Chaenocephalus aceratus]